MVLRQNRNTQIFKKSLLFKKIFNHCQTKERNNGQPHLNLDFFKLPEQGSREDALPTQRDYLLSIM